jgi:hypothetical protein
MPNISTCNSPTCAVTVDGKVQTCPKCGGPMRHLTESKARAWVLIFCGLFLIGLMGVITIYTAPMMLSPGTDMGGSSWEGTLEQGQLAVALFAIIILLGGISLINGVYMLKTGKQNKGLIVLTIAVAIVLAVVVYLLTRTFKGE